LGLEAVHRVVLASELFDEKNRPPASVNLLISLRLHSLATATIASQLLPDKKQQEDAFVAALLHDIGKLLIAIHLPEHHKATIDHAKNTGISLHAAEIDLFGVSHAEVGAYLLGIWGLPYFIVEAVANHHEPSRVDDPVFGVLGAVHVSNVLSHTLIEKSTIAPDFPYLERIGVSDQWPEWVGKFKSQIAGIVNEQEKR
jgi:putative nucleotidyltransferase with HDIG domain